MDIFDRIDMLLKEYGVSQAELSRKTGISTGLISQWKKRSQNPSGDKLSLVAKCFGVSVDYLLTGDKEKETPAKADVNDGDIKFALSGGDGAITDAQYEEVKKFVQFIKERDKK